MTKVKLCGLTRIEDIEAVNSLMPEYIGFVFAEKSKRRVTDIKAARFRAQLNPEIKAVGVFVNESVDKVAFLLKSGIIDIAQLHGDEDDEYIRKLKELNSKPVIKAFEIRTKDDIAKAES
ncbi:MAG: phosphoribosylanthranilate isomerase, partial [Ruminococcus sp.]|nr:phosphoribosylanthranilate isomerase [Ruminococcus sp.]